VNVVDPLVLLQHDHKGQNLPREQAGGIADGRAALQYGLEELIKDKLITSTKHIIKRLQFGNLIKDDLRGGGKRTAHSGSIVPMATYKKSPPGEKRGYFGDTHRV
jgi:hypothetical protein